MSEQAQLHEASLLYSPQRALETVQAISGLTPVRIFPVLFPLWEIEVKGIQQRSYPYEVLDRFLERGIAEGELTSTNELANFFGLKHTLINKALTRLQTIGHIQQENGTLALTNLGYSSLKDGLCYRNMETRRKLYFEAFHAHPLPQKHYRLKILSGNETRHLPDHRLTRLFSFKPWQSSALTSLAQWPDRADWNLPDEVCNLEEVGVAPAYLPMYIIEAREQATTNHFANRYVVLTRLQGLRDNFFEKIVNSELDLLDSLFAGTVPNVKRLIEEKIADWGLIGQVRLTQVAPDVWRATVMPKALLSPQTHLASTDIGNYQLIRGYCLQVWCDDPALRREVALDRALDTIIHWQRPITLQTVNQLLQTLASRLQIEELDLAELCKRASKRGSTDVSDRLKELETGF